MVIEMNYFWRQPTQTDDILSSRTDFFMVNSGRRDSVKPANREVLLTKLRNELKSDMFSIGGPLTNSATVAVISSPIRDLLFDKRKSANLMGGCPN